MNGLRLFGLWLLLCLGGCLEVESMEVRVVADRAQDRLDVMIVSRGLWSTSGSESGLAEDLADMRKCRDVSALPVPGIGVVDFTTPKVEGKPEEDWHLLAQFLDIEPGAFFLDEQQRLCFYQFVRVNRLREFLGKCNEVARGRLLQQSKQSSRETQILIEDAVKAKLEFIAIDGAGFLFRVPMVDEDHRTQQTALWRSVARSIETAMGTADKSDGTERGVVQHLRDNDVAIVRRKGLTEYVVGTQGSDICDYQVRGRRYTDNLLKAFVVDEPAPPAVTQAIIDKQFEGFHARQARLPAAYRALRSQGSGAPARDK
jgi:hypothetical protein